MRNVDLSGIGKAVDSATVKSQFALTQQVLADTTPYVPFLEGELSRSALRMSTDTQLIWDTPYARRLYYNPEFNFTTKHHPLAGGMWFERAKANHHGNWQIVAERAVKRYL
jgi:hypothetical protein